MTFTSARISKTNTITLNASLKAVFPLFGLIREKEWADGWDPQIIYSTTNLVEEHMVFRTTSPHEHKEQYYTWIVSKYQPERSMVEYTVFTSERVWWITVQCREVAANSTSAEITYTYTGLTERGNRINEKALAQMYAHDLKDWEDAVNHYLLTGQKLPLQTCAWPAAT